MPGDWARLHDSFTLYVAKEHRIEHDTWNSCIDLSNYDIYCNVRSNAIDTTSSGCLSISHIASEGPVVEAFLTPHLRRFTVPCRSHPRLTNEREGLTA